MAGGQAKAGRRRRTVRAPRVQRPYVFTHGPLVLQRALGTRGQAYPDPPGWWRVQYPAGSLPEWAIWWGHTKLGLLPNIHFSYQDAFAGGRRQFGGIIVDFIELDIPGIAINVQGRFWHLLRGQGQIARDKLQAERLLTGYGVQLVFVDEGDALIDPIRMVRDARVGQDHSAMGKHWI